MTCHIKSLLTIMSFYFISFLHWLRYCINNDAPKVGILRISPLASVPSIWLIHLINKPYHAHRQCSAGIFAAFSASKQQHFWRLHLIPSNCYLAISCKTRLLDPAARSRSMPTTINKDNYSVCTPFSCCPQINHR